MRPWLPALVFSLLLLKNLQPRQPEICSFSLSLSWRCSVLLFWRESSLPSGTWRGPEVCVLLVSCEGWGAASPWPPSLWPRLWSVHLRPALRLRRSCWRAARRSPRSYLRLLNTFHSVHFCSVYFTRLKLLQRFTPLHWFHSFSSFLKSDFLKLKHVKKSICPKQTVPGKSQSDLQRLAWSRDSGSPDWQPGGAACSLQTWRR